MPKWRRPKYQYHKKLRAKRRWLLLVAVITAILIGGLATIELAPGFVANVADNVLRPVIGNRPTIALESAMLSLSDSLKRLAYGTVAKPNGNIYNAEPGSQSALDAQAKALSAKASALTRAQAISLTPLNYFQPGLPKLVGEGEWSLVGLPQFKGAPLMARTIVRPDAARSYAIVALIQMNMHLMHLHSVAGTYYPGAELGHPGPGVIPAVDINGNKLVAGFNGGFQYKDGHYGMVVGTNTYVPLLVGSGSLTIYQDGSLAIDRYTLSVVPSKKPIASIRQNGPLIVDKGGVTADAVSGGYQVWGRTTTNSIYTWRSGVGITKNGNLIYAVGPSLTAETLAKALQAGGAVEAIQLDINSFWVRFATFTPTGPGAYSYESILNTLQNGGSSYLHGYNKDFFYVTLN